MPVRIPRGIYFEMLTTDFIVKKKDLTYFYIN